MRAELIQLEKRTRGKLNVYVFTKDPARIREYLSDIICDTDTRKLNVKILKSFTSCIGIKTIPVLAMCDKVVIGGGGLFFSGKPLDISVSQLLNLFIITLLLKLLGKDSMIYAAGCSNLNSKVSRYKAKVVLNNAKFITARDELTMRTFRELSKRQIIRGADPAFLLEPLKSERVDRIIESWPQGRKILLCLHELIFVVKHADDEENVLKRFLAQVVEFARHNSCTLLTYTNHTDQKYAFEIAELCGRTARPALPGENHLLPEELIYLFSKVDFVIASQMHSCMFAYLARVPFVSLVYADKVDEFNKLVGNQNVLQVDQMWDGVKIGQLLDKAMAAGPLNLSQDVIAKAKMLCDILVDFIESNN